MFLNPLMLFGISAVSIPIIIHMLNKRKFERVVWAAMRFLKVSVEQNQRRIQVEDMLLLLLRCLLVLLIVMVLSRPVLNAVAAALGRSPVTAVIVLDNSASMCTTDGVESRFGSAKKAAEEVLRSLPNGSAVAVILGFNDKYELIPKPSYDLTLVATRVKDAPLYDRPTNLYPAVRAAIDLLAGEPSTVKEIYVISDGQASGFQQLADIRKQLEDKKNQIRPHIILVGRTEDKNLAVTAVRMDPGIAAVNQPLRVDVRIRNFGKNEARDVPVSIQVDGDPAMDQASIDVIPPGEEKGLSLFAKLKSEGYHVITARTDADHVPADDSRTVAVRAVKAVKVLLIDGDTGREARDSEVFYLKHALRSVPRSQWEDYYIKLPIKLPTEAETLRFEDFDAVVAANVTDFSTGVVNQLATYVKNGGALWVFPGDRLNVNFYNEQLYTRTGLLPAMFGPAVGDAKSTEKWGSLSDRAFDHEIVAVWKDPAAGALSSGKIFRYLTLIPDAAAEKRSKGDGRSDVRVIARFSDDSPAMIERNVGMGRVIQWATTADTDWNDLGARAGIYVPLVNRTLGYMVARQDERLTIRTGTPFTYTAPIELANKDVQINKRARGWSDTAKELNEVSESRRVEMVDGVPTIAFADTNFAGPYEIKGENTTIRFAAQADPDESNMELVSSEQVKVMESFAHVVRWTPGMSMADTIDQVRTGTEIWFPLAIIVLILATAETFLAHWFSKSK